MSTVYLESDDEITSAIARIRAVTDTDAIVVVPSGSRIATSRINFKLLAREAAERKMNVVAVSDEPQVRALAISAGLPAYDSIPMAQQALATFRDQDRILNERIHRTMPREHPAGTAAPTHTQVLPPSIVARGAAASAAEHTAVLPAQQAAAARKPRQRRAVPIAPLLVLGLVVLLVAGVAYGAYVYLPTASITLRPAATQIQAPAFSVTADPNVAVVDADQGVVPAQQISVPVRVSGTFTATGIDARDIKAAGSVRFKSENTLNAVSIPANTVVSTVDGTDFLTVDDVVAPKASFATGPSHVDVDVRAAKGGTKGNVAAGAITVVPQQLSQQLISVTNPAPTSGGDHIEGTVVSQADYDAALASLSSQLEGALVSTLANPQSVPRGLTAYPQTAEMSAGQPDQVATDLVGTAATTFTLALDSVADLTAVNESLIDDVAAARLSDTLQPGQKLLTDDVTSTHDQGTVTGNTITYSVNASGQGYVEPDPQVVIAAVKGKTVTAARAALSSYGTADISVWPDFVDHLPDQAARISVIIVPPSLTPSPSRSPFPSPSRSASPAPSPQPTTSTGPSAS